MSEYFNLENLNVQRGFNRLASIKPDQPIPGGMRFLSQAGKLDIVFYQPGIIRMRLNHKPVNDYGLLVGEQVEVPVEIKTGKQSVSLISEDVEFEVFPSPIAFRLKKGGKVILETTTDRSMENTERFFPFAKTDHGDWQMAWALKSDEAVYGLGEKFGRLNHRGELITSWDYDALSVNSERSYKNVPFAWSPKGWGMFVHTPGRVKHAVGFSVWSHRNYVLQIEDQNLDVFLFAVDSPAEVIKKYTDLTGSSPELPDWSYGVWMARGYYHTAEELMEAVQGMRDRNIPLDVILLDGQAWHKRETRFDFTWDPDRYPDPPAFVKQLKDLNVRLCLWEYTYISTFNPLFHELADKNYLLKTTDDEPYIHRWMPEPYDMAMPQLMPSGIIDLTNPDAYAWFRDQHKPLFEMGVAVMKTDFGEAVPEHVVAYNGDSGKRLHNVYPILYNRCVYEAAEMYGEGKPLVWGRSGWIGSQRYPIQWGGDPQTDWEGLAASIRGGQAWGLSGNPFYAHDIGGFYGDQPGAELIVRWTQAGIFTSHTRFHGRGPREPWHWGEAMQLIICKWINFRYRLLPYLKICEKQAVQESLPVMRAMVLAFPEDRAAWAFEQQYMFGPSLLVAPITEPGGEKCVYLPHGDWYDIWHGQKFEGGQVIQLENFPLDEIPVFGRAGTSLPLGPEIQHTNQLEGKLQVNEIWQFGESQMDLVKEWLDADVVEENSAVIKKFD
jgi:alpha-D-xyloside xylohydrolase